MGTFDRFAGCFLGMAVGDAIGAQTLDAPDPTQVPLVTPLEWTEQTQHLTLTARGLVEAMRWPYDRRVIGRSVAAEMVRWYHDPTTPARRPGRSSLAAVVRLLEGADWETSGNPSSDGADPLPRAVAVGLAFSPGEVIEPARTVTGITHLHPTAVQGAVLVANLVSRLARGAPLVAATFEEATAFAAEAVPAGKATRSMRVALDLARRSDPATGLSLDPHAIPPGDCGQRCGSAIGLASLLTLAYGGNASWRRLQEAVAAAAGIPHGSEVVAALTGALLGTAWGLGALPAHLVEAVEGRDGLIDLARALHLAARGLGPDAERRGDLSTEPGGWMAPTPEVPAERWARPPQVGTDLEWTLTGPAGEAPERAHAVFGPASAPDPEGVRWITVGNEDRVEMEKQDADLLANIHRRW